jgi:shikimate kinase
LVGAQVRTRVQNKTSRKPVVSFPSNAVFLVGFMGAGKTSVGRALGQRLNWIFEDLDDRIERQEGQTVPEIFRNSGEQTFRRAEHRALGSLLEECCAADPPAVARSSSPRTMGRIIALGGGAYVQKENAVLLESSQIPTIFLDAPVEELWQRCRQQATSAGTERPLLRSPEQFRKLYAQRRKSYSKAHITIQTSNRSVDEIAAEIAHALGLKEIPVRIEQGEVE